MKKLKTFLALGFFTLTTLTFSQKQKIKNLQITGGSPGLGKLLVSDADGNVQWLTAGQLGLVDSGDSVINTKTVPVISSTGRIWMDRNLGASRVALSFNDYFAYGNIYQWGRSNDGHQLMYWTSNTSGTPVNNISSFNLSVTDYPNHNMFIVPTGLPYDWRVTKNDNLWQGITGVNKPCPEDYRLPTSIELANEMTAYNITNSASAFNSPLKFTVPGSRSNTNGQFMTTGSNGLYWTSSVSGSNAVAISISPEGAGIANIYRFFGASCRCIKN